MEEGAIGLKEESIEMHSCIIRDEDLHQAMKALEVCGMVISSGNTTGWVRGVV